MALIVVTACATPGTTPQPSPTPAPGGVPTQAPADTGSADASEKCTGIPTANPDNLGSIPKFSPDPADAPTFPNIGEELTPAISYARWLDSACVFGGEELVEQYVARLPNVNFETLMVATSNDMLGQDQNFASINLVALRSPGRDASELNAMFWPLALGSTGTGLNEVNYSQSTVSLGGKTVTVWTDPTSDEVTYSYVAGDTAYGLYHATEELAATVFAALP
jgi:hypothetical protein